MPSKPLPSAVALRQGKAKSQKSTKSAQAGPTACAKVRKVGKSSSKPLKPPGSAADSISSSNVCAVAKNKTCEFLCGAVFSETMDPVDPSKPIEWEYPDGTGSADLYCSNYFRSKHKGNISREECIANMKDDKEYMDVFMSGRTAGIERAKRKFAKGTWTRYQARPGDNSLIPGVVTRAAWGAGGGGVGMGAGAPPGCFWVESFGLQKAHLDDKPAGDPSVPWVLRSARARGVMWTGGGGGGKGNN